MQKKGTLYMVQLSVLTAIILLMAFTPIGYIKTLGLEITLIVIPVAVGAILMGPWGGAFLGGVFGITSFIQCFGMSYLGTALFQINPFFTFLVCVPTRIITGWLTGLVFVALKKSKRTRHISYYVASLTCPICNTVLFMGTLCIFFYHTAFIQGFVEALGATNVLLFIILFVWLNGLVEIAVSFVAGSALSRILVHALRNTDSEVN